MINKISVEYDVYLNFIKEVSQVLDYELFCLVVDYDELGENSPVYVKIAVGLCLEIGQSMPQHIDEKTKCFRLVKRVTSAKTN